MTEVYCKKCGTVLVGDGKGTYISCPCRAVAIDETEYYCRIIGNLDNWFILDESTTPNNDSTIEKEQKDCDKKEN